jgi:tetratricopeptide (TPR) repeat protein
MICHGTISMAATQYSYEYNSNCSKAYGCYMSLHFGDARKAVINEMVANPYNLMPTYLSDYEDCLTLLLNCNKEDYEQRKDHFESRLELLNKGDENSPWYRFCKAGLYLHWAIVNTRFGDQYKAAIKFRKSFLLLQENERLFPDFEYNRVFSGLQEAVIGSLPGNYKWIVAIFGIKGNLKQGTGKLISFIDTHTDQQLLFQETVLYYTYTRFYLSYEQKEVWNFLTSKKFSTRNNLLNCFVKTNIALDYRHTNDAIETLKEAASDGNYAHFPIFDYQMGLALLTKSDITCTVYFDKYQKNNKSDLYVKECWQKMAWAWYIAGDGSKAEYCRAQIKLHGSARLDADKQAEKFAEGHTWPDKRLLQARLLIDGGYASEAITILNTLDKNAVEAPAYKSEYYFRLGRANEELNDNKKALEFYESAITTGKERHEQFAARAALQTGRIYELSGMKTMAMESYKECLAMPEHDFQNSIDQQAKAGINRVEGN